MDYLYVKEKGVAVEGKFLQLNLLREKNTKFLEWLKKADVCEK